ncbi:MAG: MFS transporter [Acidimicrobiales bacterium]
MTTTEPTPATSTKLGANYFRLFGASTISNLGDGIGTIAYPWLASATTRSALLISLVVVVQRLPWLLFSLPAGVITDRVDRRKLMIGSNAVRAAIAGVVALVVLAQQADLPSPDELDAVVLDGTNWTLYLVLLVATLALGTAEVLYDNTAQTFMPSIVHTSNLEKANGRLWSAEQVTNTFAGPVLGALLIAAAFALPFGVDAATFAISALLIARITVRTEPKLAATRSPWQQELREGVRWLWHHSFLRPLAIILGLINMLGMLTISTLVLYGQEVLGTNPTEFAIMSTGGAIGGVVAGWTASSVSERIGAGPSLALTIVGGGIVMILTGLTSSWIVVWVLFAFFMFVAVLWNVITVALRQTIIPDDLLGRVNSVYRFFAWGMMPIGALLGGVIIAVVEPLADRELALRAPWIIGGIAHVLVYLYAGPRLTSSAIAAARASAPSKHVSTDDG